MKAVLAIVVGALAGGFLLLVLLLGLERVFNGWPAALLLAGLAFFPAFWLMAGLGWARGADARARGAPPWLGVLGLDCPRCRHAAMPPPRKWLLGGRATARCRHCGLLLTHDRLPTMVLLAPPLAALLMAPVIGGVVRGISPWAAIAWLQAAGWLVTVFMAFTRPFLACEPLAAPPAAAHAPGGGPADPPDRRAP
ncbi:hypothetical protein [Ottowia testudinis]|uniref:Uncharacterized protein n=1 Tax=Ottowia testudinis TaxID=2816950 RepID=A0A975H4Z9_9BURK|nr:hypothetical protein [Ottowia testudinis]QTD46846.1 hypothetical protein J1M35_08230 [Ottowia testudinis]